MRFVVLPQAVRSVAPALLNDFVSTPSAISQPAWAAVWGALEP